MVVVCSTMPGKGRRAALVLANSRPPKGIKKAREVTKVTCQEELTSLMVGDPIPKKCYMNSVAMDIYTINIDK